MNTVQISLIDLDQEQPEHECVRAVVFVSIRFILSHK